VIRSCFGFSYFCEKLAPQNYEARRIRQNWRKPDPLNLINPTLVFPHFWGKLTQTLFVSGSYVLNTGFIVFHLIA
jgi:hypothetical protein